MPDMIGGSAFETALRFTGRLSFCEFCLVVGVASCAGHPNLRDRDGVECWIELVVPAPGRAVSCTVRAGDLD
ncbi:hypothetical protein, partial [Streptomyces virginiae]|uniref:hypothetical protein n=1 Tax=Streptomyces virginiae TaxID=1961 RepID=UPI001BDE41CE